jgi:hypothetical protein
MNSENKPFDSMVAELVPQQNTRFAVGLCLHDLVVPFC